MKKNILLFLCFISLLSNAADLLISHTNTVFVFRYAFASASAGSQQQYTSFKCLGSEIFYTYLNFSSGLKFNSSFSLLSPNPALAVNVYTNDSRSVDYPLVSSSINYSLANNCPAIISLFSLSGRMLKDGFQSSGYSLIHTNSSDQICYNFFPIRFISDVISSSNVLWRSELFQILGSVSESLGQINTSINNINVDLGQFQNDYQSVNWDSLNFSSFVDSVQSLGYIDSVSANYYKDNFNSLSGDSQIGYARNISSMLNNFMKMSNDSNWVLLSRNSNKVDQVSRRIGDSFGAGAAGHYTTPLTNAMKRMTTDWSNDVTNQLSLNTQKIKDDLAAWKNQLHGTQTSIDNSAANINNTLNNIAGGSSVVRVNVQNQDIGVTITDPVTIDPTQFNAFSEDLGKAGDYMERLFNEFKWWSWDSPDSWKKGFLDRDFSRLSSNVEDQVSTTHSISNLLANFFSNFTNDVTFAVSNAIAGLENVSTNDYMLLSDYADYITSKGLDDLVDVLDDDTYSSLKDELFSIGADDTAKGYGRWWRYFTGISTIQANSIFQLNNLFQDHHKLIDDFRSENSDVSSVDDPIIFKKILSSIPSQTEIDSKLNLITNSIDSSGFDSLASLVPDLTNKFNEVSELYNREFHLPTEISWVLIPADSTLHTKERLITIRPAEHRRAFDMLHYGIAFAYVIVNIILLPKFLLLFVRLFDRVWNKSEKIIYNAVNS